MLWSLTNWGYIFLLLLHGLQLPFKTLLEIFCQVIFPTNIALNIPELLLKLLKILLVFSQGPAILQLMTHFAPTSEHWTRCWCLYFLLSLLLWQYCYSTSTFVISGSRSLKLSNIFFKSLISFSNESTLSHNIFTTLLSSFIFAFHSFLAQGGDFKLLFMEFINITSQ